MNSMLLAEFHAACKAQATSCDLIVFKCPMCSTLQNARDLIAAGAGDDFNAVERYLGFSCVGRFTGAASPRKEPDGQPCNWTLGGLFQTHRFEVVTPDGQRHPRFELADLEAAEAHRAVRQHKGDE
ncbi:VVA0879 family protein [Bordetella bronchiseptica]|uniref:VVA0879 family protein n=1 Tax=Bordetella bronchiseptica TaxID=518 RepID=UPI00124631F2|nr:VVA0879 family protein [Bordetella bronchiseptica]KAB1444166.1 hypothetical protein F7D00_21125 [Bordetella bronchiseptica]KAB1569272.1 hypothetical protein F7890_21125 [Bordetella bronchiseptica]